MQGNCTKVTWRFLRSLKMSNKKEIENYAGKIYMKDKYNLEIVDTGLKAM